LVEKGGLVELGRLWKRLTEVVVVGGTVLQAAEAGENTQLSGGDTTVLRRKTPTLQNVWLCTNRVDNIDGLEGNTVMTT
jgi:hypothetical protein